VLVVAQAVAESCLISFRNGGSMPPFLWYDLFYLFRPWALFGNFLALLSILFCGVFVLSVGGEHQQYSLGFTIPYFFIL